MTDHGRGGAGGDAEAHVLQPFLRRLLGVMKIHASELDRSIVTAIATVNALGIMDAGYQGHKSGSVDSEVS